MLAANVNILHSQNLRSPRPHLQSPTHPPLHTKQLKRAFLFWPGGPFMSRLPDIESKKQQNSANLLRDAFVRRGPTVHCDDT